MKSEEALLAKIEEAKTDCSSTGNNTLVLNVSTTEDKTSVKQELTVCFVGAWEEAPWYARDNEYILKGYRIGFTTTRRILKSLFMCHNETINVWSHLIGAVYFLIFLTYLTCYLWPSSLPSPDTKSLLESLVDYIEYFPAYVKLYIFHIDIPDSVFDRINYTESVQRCKFRY